MPPKPPTTAIARVILAQLLDRFERPNRKTVVRVRLNPADHLLYHAADDPTPRHETNAYLQTLAHQGIVKLSWVKHEVGNWLSAVDLQTDHADAIYALLERTPRQTQRQTLQDILSAQTPCRDWHAAFLGWAMNQLATHASVTPLDLSDEDYSRDLLSALDALAQLGEPMLERTFSVRVFHDSKRFNALRRAVIRILRAHGSDDAVFGEDDDADDALLRAHGLHRVPEYVALAGSLVLKAHGVTADTSAFAPSVALSAAYLRQASVVECTANAVVTVENATSFSELANVLGPATLAVFTGGFASPTVIQLLRRIRALRPDISMCHWGDLDAGGLRILAHLRRSVGEIAPLAMDHSLFEMYRAFAQPLTTGDRLGLIQLRGSEMLTDLTDVVDALLHANQKLEQEAVSAEAAMACLNK